MTPHPRVSRLDFLSRQFGPPYSVVPYTAFSMATIRPDGIAPSSTVVLALVPSLGDIKSDRSVAATKSPRKTLEIIVGSATRLGFPQLLLDRPFRERKNKKHDEVGQRDEHEQAGRSREACLLPRSPIDDETRISAPSTRAPRPTRNAARALAAALRPGVVAQIRED